MEFVFQADPLRTLSIFIYLIRFKRRNCLHFEVFSYVIFSFKNQGFKGNYMYHRSWMCPQLYANVSVS